MEDVIGWFGTGFGFTAGALLAYSVWAGARLLLRFVIHDMNSRRAGTIRMVWTGTPKRKVG